MAFWTIFQSSLQVLPKDPSISASRFWRNLLKALENIPPMGPNWSTLPPKPAEASWPYPVEAPAKSPPPVPLSDTPPARPAWASCPYPVLALAKRLPPVPSFPTAPPRPASAFWPKGVPAYALAPPFAKSKPALKPKKLTPRRPSWPSSIWKYSFLFMKLKKDIWDPKCFLRWFLLQLTYFINYVVDGGFSFDLV